MQSGNLNWSNFGIVLQREGGRPTYHPFKARSTALRLPSSSTLALSVLVHLHLHLFVVIVERNLSTVRACWWGTSLCNVLVTLLLEAGVAQVNWKAAWMLAEVLFQERHLHDRRLGIEAGSLLVEGDWIFALQGVEKCGRGEVGVDVSWISSPIGYRQAGKEVGELVVSGKTGGQR